MKILIDSSNIVHKAFNAVLYQIMNKIILEENLEKPLAKEKALEEINCDLVLHSVFSMIETMKIVLKAENNDLIFAFDNGSWRKDFLNEFNVKTHSLNGKTYELNNIQIEYKEGRDKSGRNVVHETLKNLENLLKEINVNTINIKGVEADDIIALLAKKLNEENNVYIVSNDKDFYQLMKQDNVSIYDTTTKEITQKSNEEAMNFYKTKILIEDSSDNISSIVPKFYKNNKEELPSIRFGEETAKNLVEEYKEFDNILNEISNRIFKKHEEYYKKENALKLKSLKWFGESKIKYNNIPTNLEYHTYNKHLENNINMWEEDFNSNNIFDNNFISYTNFKDIENIKSDKPYKYNCYLKIENPLNLNDDISNEVFINLIQKSSNFKEILQKKFNINVENKKEIQNFLNNYLIEKKSNKNIMEKIYNDFYDNSLKFYQNLNKITKCDGMLESTENIEMITPFKLENIKLENEVDFNQIENSNYSLEDIKNILRIYLDRNLKMMDFDKIPENIKSIVNKEIINLNFNSNLLSNSEIANILNKYKLFSLSKKYLNKDVDLYIN